MILYDMVLYHNCLSGRIIAPLGIRRDFRILAHGLALFGPQRILIFPDPIQVLSTFAGEPETLMSPEPISTASTESVTLA